ncbi:reverse transcriptase domain-containing protein [Tanacetum coccineum]
MGRLRASSPSTHHPLHPSPPLLPPPSSLHLPPPVPTSLPLPSSPLPVSLFIPPVNRREDIPEAKLPPHKRLCLTALTLRYEVGESSTAAPRPTGNHRADYRDSYQRHWDRFRNFRLELRLMQMIARAMNNMPPRRSSATLRATAAATPMTAVALEHLIEARVYAGTEGVVVLSQWLEKMESVFHISNCAVENQVKFATCTFLGNALTWWNSHMKTLALMCRRMFHEESEEVEKYVGGLPDMIRGNVMSYQPKTMEKSIEFANDQMDQKVITITERQAEQKMKLEFNAGNNQGYQQQNKRQNTGRAYTAGPGEKREYTGSLLLCIKCNYHHKGPCAPRCNKCKKIGHLARDCRSSGPNCNNNNRGNSGNAGTCYECGV